MMPRSAIYLDGRDLERDYEALMRFRLTYKGPVYATQDRTDAPMPAGRAAHKHSLRVGFHKQLRRLWSTNRFLSTTTMLRPDIPHDGPEHARPQDGATWGFKKSDKVPLVEGVASLYPEFGFNFVPLVRETWSLSCSLRVLFLRRDPPGSVYTAGDLDNRMKTVIDALSKPTAMNQIPANPEDHGGGPFFVLLENDKLITHLEIESDTLLDPLGTGDEDRAKAHLVITVDIRIHEVTMFNLGFSS